jgi:2-(1,2-epoxy-1,2-dihydrophenyl)acetyl-CoA isomerase
MAGSGVSITSDRDDTAIVTIDRPEVRNALDAATAAGIADAIEQCSQEARVIILTGAGGAFCAGGDLAEISSWSKQRPEEVATTLYGSFQRMIRSIRSSTSIVIAAIDGAAVGAGLDLALACDLRLATPRAKLGQVWVRLGLIPGTGGALLTQALIGPGRAADLLLTGRLVLAPEALEIGLVNRVVGGDLMHEAGEIAADILKHPRQGVVANKQAMIAVTQDALDAALAYAARVQAERFVSDEFKKALRETRS